MNRNAIFEFVISSPRMLSRGSTVMIEFFIASAISSRG